MGEVDLTAPIQLVHDVAREAELGSHFKTELPQSDGEFYMTSCHEHTDAEVIIDFWSPYITGTNNFNTRMPSSEGVDPSIYTVWLLSVHFQSSTALTQAEIYFVADVAALNVGGGGTIVPTTEVSGVLLAKSTRPVENERASKVLFRR